MSITIASLSSPTAQLREQWLPVLPIPVGASLAGKTAIVTGASSGIGLATAHHLAGLNPKKLIMTGRTSSNMAAAFDSVMDATNSPATVPWQLDLCSHESIIRFVERVQRHGQVDLLILNAGINMPEWQEEAGHEVNLQTNVYGTFLLFFLLLPLLKQTNGRCIIVTSASYAFLPQPPAQMTLSELDVKERAEAAAKSKEPSLQALTMANRYLLSKMLQLLLARAVAENLKEASITLVNPGMASTMLFRNLNFLMAWVVWLIGLFCARSISEASQITLFPAFLPPESSLNGKYYSNCRESPVLPWIQSNTGQAMGRRLLAELIESLSKVDKRVGAGLV